MHRRQHPSEGHRLFILSMYLLYHFWRWWPLLHANPAFQPCSGAVTLQEVPFMRLTYRTRSSSASNRSLPDTQPVFFLFSFRLVWLNTRQHAETAEAVRENDAYNCIEDVSAFNWFVLHANLTAINISRESHFTFICLAKYIFPFKKLLADKVKIYLQYLDWVHFLSAGTPKVKDSFW